MELLIVRHAPAEDRLEFESSEKNDALRALTPKGRKRMRLAAKGLRQLMPVIDVLATSPLVRAVETAEIIADAYKDIGLIQVPALAPGVGPEELGRWLATQPDEACVAVVGHEPDLSLLVAWLTAGTDRSFARFGKAGACLLECEAPVTAGGCELLWMLTPKQLRLIR